MSTDDVQADKQKRPAFQFFWTDYLRHDGLRLLRLEHRGLAVELMCRMAGSAEYGVLLLGERTMSTETIARLAGEPVERVEELLNDLLNVGVFDRRADGTIFSPRMMRDERIRRVKAEAGKLSVNHPTVARRIKGGGKGGGKGTRKGAPMGTQMDTHREPFTPSPSSSYSSSGSDSFSESKAADAATPKAGSAPIEAGRLYLHPWQTDAIRALLGPHMEAFGLTSWLETISEKADAQGLAFPSKETRWAWVLGELRAEIERRRLPIATVSEEMKARPNEPRSNVPSVEATRALYLNGN